MPSLNADQFTIAVNGAIIDAENIDYDATTSRVTLGLRTGSVETGEAVAVEWQNLHDTHGGELHGSTTVAVH